MTCIVDALLMVTPTDQSVVWTAEAAALHIQLFDDKGHVNCHTCHCYLSNHYNLDAMLAAIVLGMSCLSQLTYK